MDRLWGWNVFLGIKLVVNGFIPRLEMKVKQHIIVECVLKELAKVMKYQGIYGILHEIIRVEFTGEPVKNVYFLIVSGLTRMFFRGYVILNLSIS